MKNIARVQNCPDVAILNSRFGLCPLYFCLAFFFLLFFFDLFLFFVSLSFCLAFFFSFLSLSFWIFLSFCLFVFLSRHHSDHPKPQAVTVLEGNIGFKSFDSHWALAGLFLYTRSRLYNMIILKSTQKEKNEEWRWRWEKTGVRGPSPPATPSPRQSQFWEEI